MSARGRPDLGEDERRKLGRLFANRLGAQAKSADAPAPEPAAQGARPEATDFSTLPGYQELRLQRAMAAVVGLENPFFRLHETAAGATTVIDGKSFVNFSSYDYLGLNGCEPVRAAARRAIDLYGTSASASRVVAGERPGHRALEAALAAHYGQEDCVVFVSGHGANVSTIGALMGPKDLIVHDSFAHNSITLGAQLSRAERRSFPHNDYDALEDVLRTHRGAAQRCLIVVEGLYSMDGDSPDLARLVEIKRRHDAWLMVDEAHGLGVLGARGFGLFEAAGVDPREVDIWMGTLSKTLAACGGFVAGAQALVEYLKCMSGGFVYSVGLSPPLAAAAEAALALMRQEPERVGRLRAAGLCFLASAKAAGLDVGLSAGEAIVPIVTGNSVGAVALSQELFARGVNVQPIIHPAVPERGARLRFFVTSEHTREQIAFTIGAVGRAIEAVNANPALRDVCGFAQKG
ncbi:aminotransferase class I/II-fold pyridoxal phosphate-dependent enzyme [Methylocella sp.]|uniref:aminotransferase class I/II-fold pyridoxal phosphate-dependent enzyme n=1 Tax=Methylocella sp. TaxID=1978226 RepID=UPI0037832051